MKTKSIFLAVLISLLFFSSCKKDAITETASLLAGKDWLEANLGEKNLIAFRFSKNQTFVKIYLKKCNNDDFCLKQVFDYEGLKYYISEVVYGQKWVVESENSIKLFWDKNNYSTITIKELKKDLLVMNVCCHSDTYVNYGNKISRLIKVKKAQQ